MVLAFADDYAEQITESVQDLSVRTASAEARARLNSYGLANLQAAWAIASGSNPIVGLMDMTVMVSLAHEAMRRSVIDPTLTPAERERPESYNISDERMEELLTDETRTFLRVLAESEREIRSMAQQVFWPDQIAQFDALLAEWWEKNPSRRRVTRVRLQDFADLRAATVRSADSGPRSLLGLLSLDPLASMEPAALEIASTRMLAERVSHQLNRLPSITFMYARGLLLGALSNEEVVALQQTLQDSGQALQRFAEVAERWPTDVARERDASLDRLASLIDARRASALEQAATVIAAERQALVSDLENALSRQREELLAAVDARTEPLENMIVSLDQALGSATRLSDSVNENVRAIDEMDLSQFQALMDSTAGGVGGVERSLATLQQILDAEATRPSAAGVNATVSHTSQSLQDLVDHMFLRGIQLIAILLGGLFIVALALRLIGRRLSRPIAPSAPPRAANQA
jgi:hypothetical protein